MLAARYSSVRYVIAVVVVVLAILLMLSLIPFTPVVVGGLFLLALLAGVL